MAMAGLSPHPPPTRGGDFRHPRWRLDFCYITFVARFSQQRARRKEFSMQLSLPRRMPRVYRGWWVVSAPFLIAALGTGAGQYGFGLFVEPLEREFGWSRAQINLSLSFTLVGGLLAPFLGWVIDRYGTKPMMAASLVLVAASFFARPLMTELWHWYALSLFQYIGYTGASMLSAGKLVGVWFQRRRNRAMAITAMGNNVGGMAFPPLMGLILTLLSWQGTYIALGVMSLLLVAYALAAVRDFPERSEVDEEFGADDGEGASDGGDSRLSHLTGRTLSEALHDRAFYAIALAIVLGTFTYSAIIPNIIPHLQDGGASLAAAVSVLTVYGLMGVVGKWAMGIVAERITARYALMANFCGQVACLLATLWTDNPLVMWTAVPLMGIFNGAFGALFQLVVQDAFGVRHFGKIMGIINFGTMVSFGVGPWMTGAVYDWAGSYDWAFVGVAIMFAVGAASLTLAGTDSS